MASADARYREQGVHPSLSVSDISFIGLTKGASRRLVASSASTLSIGSVSSSASARPQHVFEQELLSQRRAERDALEQIRCPKSVSLMQSIAFLHCSVACCDWLPSCAACLSPVYVWALMRRENCAVGTRNRKRALKKNSSCPLASCLTPPRRNDSQSCTNSRVKASACGDEAVLPRLTFNRGCLVARLILLLTLPYF
jgi:hypothetical protein